MNILQSIKDMLGYIYEGVARVFGPNKDDYPQVGESPFEGDPNKSHKLAD